jgi:hypothetical protein
LLDDQLRNPIGIPIAIVVRSPTSDDATTRSPVVPSAGELGREQDAFAVGGRRDRQGADRRRAPGGPRTTLLAPDHEWADPEAKLRAIRVEKLRGAEAVVDYVRDA